MLVTWCRPMWCMCMRWWPEAEALLLAKWFWFLKAQLSYCLMFAMQFNLFDRVANGDSLNNNYTYQAKPILMALTWQIFSKVYWILGQDKSYPNCTCVTENFNITYSARKASEIFGGFVLHPMAGGKTLPCTLPHGFALREGFALRLRGPSQRWQYLRGCLYV